MLGVTRVDIDVELKKIFAEALGISGEEVAIAELNKTQGWDSFAHMRLMVSIDSEIGLGQISPDVFASLSSYGKILEFLNDTKRR